MQASDIAHVSLPGDRPKNQDRVRVVGDGDALLLIAVDGMGGHAEGERAAEVTVATLAESFLERSRPLLDPQGFLTLALARAHESVVGLGASVPLDHRPRATCAVCLVQDAGAYWAHVGDSRIYQLRAGTVVERTRDHSHVELLLREGLIAESEMKTHPMRNFVECCLGGDRVLPDMSITARKRLAPGDLMLVCTDGLWSGIDDQELAASLTASERSLNAELKALAETAVTRNAPYSDNTSAAVLRWRG